MTQEACTEHAHAPPGHASLLAPEELPCALDAIPRFIKLAVSVFSPQT